MSFESIDHFKERYLLPITTILSSSAIASLVCVIFFYQQNFKLGKLPSFAVGDALLAGIDSPKRQTVYYALLLIFAVTYIISQKFIRYALLSLKNRLGRLLDFLLYLLLYSSAAILAFIPFYLSGLYISQFQCIFFNITVCAFTFILFQLVYYMYPKLSIRYINVFYWALFFLVITSSLQISIFIRSKTILLTFYSHAILGVMAGIFLVLITSIYLIKSGKLRFQHFLCPRRSTSISIFIIIAAAEFIIHSLINAGSPISLFGTSKYVFFASLFCFIFCIMTPAMVYNSRTICTVLSPFIIAPFFYTFSSEVQFFLTKWFFVPTFIIYDISLLLLVIVSLAIWWFRPKIRLSCLLTYWYYPVIILTVYTATMWEPVSILNGTDTLHPGNVLATPQQILSFGKIPYIDFWPGRGLYDSFLSTIYALAWQTSTDWIQVSIPRIFQHPLMGCMLFYALFNFFYPPTVAFLICMAFIGVFNPIYLPLTYVYPSALLILIALLAFLPKLTKLKIMGTWLSCVLVFLLHAASGTFGAYALLLTYFTLYYRKLKIFLIVSFYGLIVLLISVLAIIFLPFDRPFIDIFQDLYLTFGSDFLVGSYRYVFNNRYITFSIFNILLPFLYILTILVLAKQPNLLTHNHIHSYRAEISVIFLSFFLLFSLSRTLARHCAYEGSFLLAFDYIIILLFFPAIFLIIRHHMRLYLSLLFIFILLFTPVRLFFNHSMRMHMWSEGDQKRVVINNPTYSNIVAFLQHNLHGQETFLSDDNAQMLYVASDRPFPFFQPSTLINQSLPGQQAYVKELNNLYNHGNLPIALLNNNPRVLYYIYPWVYAHFIPYTVIDSRQVWLAKDSRLAKKLISMPMQIPPQHEEWELLAGIYGHTLELMHQLHPSSLDFVELSSTIEKFHISSDNFSKDGIFVTIKILAPEGARIKGYAKSENCEGTFSFTVEPTNEARWFALPLKSLYAFFENPSVVWLQTDRPAFVNLRPADKGH